MNCPHCGQALPGPAVDCPHCFARRLARLRASNGALQGGAIALALGLLVSTLLLASDTAVSDYSWAIIALPALAFAFGAGLGYRRARAQQNPDQ